MPALVEAPMLLRSGPLVIDRARRQARLDGRLLALSRLPLAILEALLRAEGRIVTRAELKQQLWPYAERIDTERRLNTAVRALREALDDTAATPSLILTVRGHGYRWIGAEKKPTRWPVLQFAAAACLALIAAPASVVQRDQTAPPAAPANLDASRDLAWRLVNAGQPSAAFPHIATLLQSARRDTAETGWLLLRAGMPEAALATCGSSAEPTLNLLSCRQTALARLGLIADARDVAVEIMRTANADPAAIRSVVEAPPQTGYARFLRWRLGVFVRPGRDWFMRAQLQADAGLYTDALASLERAAAVRDPLLVKLRSSAEFAPLRTTAAYQRIAANV